jgi:hypothetical protein
MHREKTASDHYLFSKIGLALVLLAIASSPRAIAQQGPGPVGSGEFTVADLLKLPGRVVSEGTNTRPVGQFKLLKYRLEEVPLPRRIKVELRGQLVEVDTGWRLIVTGGPFPVRALPAVIWVDDQTVGYGIENERMSEITAITFDHSLLRNGGTISLSYGDDRRDRIELPDKLNSNGAR